jgi:hypothetical protein
MAFLLLAPAEWVHRRVERVSLIDDETVRREISVDFTYPLTSPSVARMRALQEGDPAQVPLAVLRKGRLANFSVQDEHGWSLPTLTSEQSGEESSRLLEAVARTALKRSQVPPELVTVLKEIVMRPPEDAWFLRYVLRRLRKQRNAKEARKRIRETVNLFDAEGDLAAMAADLAGHHRAASALVESEPAWRLIGELGEQFVLLVPLDPADLQRRRIVEFTYEEGVQGNAGMGYGARLGKWLMEGCSYRGRTYRFEGSRPGDAQSSHLEVTAPTGIEITKALFVATPSHDGERPAEDEVGFANEAVHMQLRDVPRSWAGTGLVTFQASRVGILSAAPVLAAMTSVLLFIGTQRTAQITPEPGAALALLIPTLLAAYLAQPGEHRLSTRLLLGVRGLVAGSGICSFVAVGALAGGWQGVHLTNIWKGCWIGAAIFTALLASSWGLTTLRRERNLNT